MKTMQQPQLGGTTNMSVPLPTQGSNQARTPMVVTPDDDDFGEEDGYNDGPAPAAQPKKDQGGQVFQDTQGQTLPNHGMKYTQGAEGLPERRRGEFDEQHSDESIDIEDCRQIREKTAANRHRVNSGVDTFSLQFAEEKRSLKMKKEMYTNTGAQFGQERVSLRITESWRAEKEERMRLRGEQDGYQ